MRGIIKQLPADNVVFINNVIRHFLNFFLFFLSFYSLSSADFIYIMFVYIMIDMRLIV